MASLERSFASACLHVSSGNVNFTPLQHMQLYALYKQATVGPSGDVIEPLSQSSSDASPSRPPPPLSSVSGADAKASAWAALRDMTADCARQMYVDTVSSIDADWQPDACSSGSNADTRTVILDHVSICSDAALPPRILSLLTRCFPGSFDDETFSDGMQNSWLFSIYDPAACVFAVASDASGRVTGFAAAAAFAASRRMNLFNLVPRPHASGAQPSSAAITVVMFVVTRCFSFVCSVLTPAAAAKALQRTLLACPLPPTPPPPFIPYHPAFPCSPSSHSSPPHHPRPAPRPARDEGPQPRRRCCAARHVPACQLPLVFFCNILNMYQSAGCSRTRTGFGSNTGASDAECTVDSASDDYIEWAVATADLARSLAPAAPSYRVRRIAIPHLSCSGCPPPHPPPSSPQHPLPPAALSQAASAAFVRGDIAGAKLLWLQLLQAPALPLSFHPCCFRLA
jgi:acyl-CoA-binding protein